MTEAAWTDTDIGAASFDALAIPAPSLQSCNVDRGLLGSSTTVTVKWLLPTSYLAANVRYFVAKSGALPNLIEALLGTDVVTTGPVNGLYTTQFKSGLLSEPLGGSYSVYLQILDPASGWTSVRAEAVASIAILGSPSRCDIVS